LLFSSIDLDTRIGITCGGGGKNFGCSSGAGGGKGLKPKIK
jgi:hypothetical protein